jgi:type III restriction enzyme
MNQTVIENPIINSPFEEPSRHFKFDDEGITLQFSPAPVAKPLYAVSGPASR